MSAKSSKSKPRRKPAPPFKGFPLFPHGSGQWAKKIRQRMFYFGAWGDPQAALEKFNREWPYLSEGRTPPPVDTKDGCTLATLCNTFLTAKQNKLDSGELSGHTFGGYRQTTDRMIAYFGRDRRIDDIRPDDFENFRKAMAKTLGVVALKNEINRCRIVLKYAFDQRLIDRPVAYGQGFDKPSARMLRKSRNEAGPNLLEAHELRQIIAAADPVLRAMVYLGINGGLGNSDVANLPKSAIDFAGGWLEYPRPKTQIARRIKLWSETCQALRVALEQRPAPKDPADADMVFLTVQGNRFVRCTPSKTTAGKFATVNTITSRFNALLKRLKINGRRRLGFYTARHCFETVAGECRDQVAVDACMGHVDASMSATYRERISDDRLQAVVATVHGWLFGAEDAKAKGTKRAKAGKQGTEVDVQDQADHDPLQLAIAAARQAIQDATGPTRKTLESVWLPEIQLASEGDPAAVRRLVEAWGGDPSQDDRPRLRVVGE